MGKEKSAVGIGSGVHDGHELPYVGQRRTLLRGRFRIEPWIVVIDALLVVLVLGDFANLFMAVETALRSGYAIILAVSISLTGLCVILPFLAGKLWRKRACGLVQSSYALVVALVVAWLALLVGITLLRLAVDGLGPFGASIIGGAGGAGSMGATGGAVSMGSGTGGMGSAIASLGKTAPAQTSASDIAMNCMLTAMLTGSGIVAFISAWAGADPLRAKALRSAEELLVRQEAYEELVALQAEYESSEKYYQSLREGDQKRYVAMQETVELIGAECKHEVRTSIAGSLSDPAATSALVAYAPGEAAGERAGKADGVADEKAGTTKDKSKKERGNDEVSTNITKLYSEFDDVYPAVARS